MAESQINVGMNVDGVVAGTEKVKRKLSELGGAARDAGTEAGKGIGSIGNGAEASAKRLDSATKNTIASLQRQTAAIEAGGTATRAYQEQLARMRGVDVAVLKPYLDQLDQAKIKQQAAVASQASMAAGFSAIKVGALAAIAVIGSFAAAFKGIVDGVDKLNDLRDATGASIENISALEDVALRTGTSFDTVGAALLKFNGVLKDSKAGSDSAAAFNALGVSVKELKALDPAEALQKVARAFAGFADDGSKARIMQELFGKSTRDVAALMKDLGEKTELAGKVTTKAADEAEIFNKSIASLQKDMLDAARAMTGPMVEGLNGLIAKFKEGSKAGDGFLTTLVRQSEIYALFAQTSQIPGFGGNLSRTPKFLLDYNQSGAETARLTRGAVRPSLADLPDQSANKAAAAEAARLLADQNRELKEQAKLLAELGGLNGSFADDWERLSKIYKAGKISLDDLVKAQAALLEKQPAIKAAADAQEKSARERVKAEQERRDELEKTLALYATASGAAVASAVSAANAAEDELATYGLLKSAVQELTLAHLQQSRELAALAGEDVSNIEIRIAAQKRLIAATQGVEAKKAAEEAQRVATQAADEAQRIAARAAADAASEWAKAAEKIQDSITDALLRGFESGKDFAANLRDTVVNMFKTMVLRPVISAVVNPVAQGLTGSLGLASSVSAATGAAGAAGASIFGSGGLIGALSGGAGWLTGSTTLSGALSAGASLIGTGSVAGLASGVGVLAGALGPIALGIGALSSLFGGEKNKQQSTGNATSFFDASGSLTRQDSFFGGSSASADTVINALQSAYAKAAAALSIGTVATAFNFGSNVRKDGSDPRFALGAYAGTSSFQQAETASSDAAMSLAASRAVFAALQGSDLPKYLSTVFNSLDPAASSQEQIASALEFAGSLKLIRDALSETRTPLQILQDDLAAGTAALSTSAATFKADFLRAIDSGITPELLTQWQALGNTMDALAATSGKAEEAITQVTRSLADIANERTRLQDQLDELTLTSEQLRAKERATIDASNVALYDQVQAQADLKLSTDAAAESARSLASTNAGLQDQLDLLTGKQTERTLALRDATDDSTRSLLNQIYAQQDLKTATAAATEAMKKLVTTQQSIAVSKAIIAGSSPQEVAVQSATDSVNNAIQAIRDLGTEVGSTVAQNITASQIEAADLTAFAGTAYFGRLQDLVAGYFSSQATLSTASRALADSLIVTPVVTGPPPAVVEDTSAAEAAAKLYTDTLAMQARLYELNGNAAGAAEVKQLQHAEALKALDPTLRALQESIWGLEDAAEAAAKAIAVESSRTSVATAYKSIQDRATATADALTATTDRITSGYLSAQDAVTAAQENVAAIARQAAQEMRGFATSIKDFLLSLSTTDLGANNRAQQFASLQADFAIASAQAKAGDTKALGGITGKASDLLTAGKGQFSSAIDFARFAGTIGNTLSDIATLADGRAGPLGQAVDPMIKAQGELVKAQSVLAKWGEAAAVSGASILRVEEDYLAEWRAARDANTIAQADLTAAQLLTAGINTELVSVLGGLRTLIESYNSARVAAGLAVVTPGGNSTGTGAIRADWQAAFDRQGATLDASVVNAMVLAGGNQADIFAAARRAGVPGFATGTNYVSQDTLAMLHEGEAVVPKIYNPAAGSQARDEAVVSEIRALREEVRGLRAEAQATAGHTSKTARLLDRAMPDGDALATRTAT